MKRQCFRPLKNAIGCVLPDNVDFHKFNESRKGPSNMYEMLASMID
jgi:hypothetical protein